MPNFQNTDGAGLRLQEVRRRLSTLRGEENGAVLLLCLAAILIVLLIGWALLDGIFVVQDKTEVQASADVGAYSQASVKARSMNMLAFTNVAKRSLVSVYATYDSMLAAYEEWLILELWSEMIWSERCDSSDTFDSCTDPEWRQNWDLFTAEAMGDYVTYQNNRAYYIADLRALHNYQEYVVSMTPWWGWSEAVLRAQRNGATLATSFPPPHIGSDFPYDSMMNQVATQAGGTAGFLRTSSLTESLPVEMPMRSAPNNDQADFYGAMYEDGMAGRDDWEWEQGLNADHHQARSEAGARDPAVIDRGHDNLPDVLRDMALHAELSRYGTPWQLDRHASSNEGRWLFATSNFVMSYRHQPEYFDGMTDKYDGIGDDLEVDPGDRTRQTYRPEGYWGLARAEISYQDEGEPDLWRPVWTARMRPVALPNEFRDAGQDFVMLYRPVVDYLLLSAHMREDLAEDTEHFFDDLVYFERVSRGLDQSTIEGVSR